MAWVSSLSLKLEEPRPRDGQGLLPSQEPGKAKLGPGLRLSDPGATVLLPASGCLLSLGHRIWVDELPPLPLGAFPEESSFPGLRKKKLMALMIMAPAKRHKERI